MVVRTLARHNTELTCKMRPGAVGGGIGARLAYREARDKAACLVQRYVTRSLSHTNKAFPFPRCRTHITRISVFSSYHAPIDRWGVLCVDLQKPLRDRCGE